MSSAEYILISAAIIVPLIARHYEAIEVVHIFGRTTASMMGAPW